ncbi:penicillinase repressor [Mycobacterium gallinarum]|uniref:Penicillinase repressor n=2 Tax=Mycobacteriaceae TaxID=1762 RepID=A0A9W4B750_9MYCO|nr:penicillinase repressor [Mycobacterium gallinarum]
MTRWTSDRVDAEYDMQQRAFGDLEAVIMDLVWDYDDPVTVRQIFDELSADRQIAYTTVMSTMDNLYRKEWLSRERSGKAYMYRPVMSREERSARLMRAAFETGGDTNAVLAFFVEQMSAEESAQLRSALRRGGNRRRR